MNKKLRTLLALVLTALLAMSLSACGGGGKNDVTGKYILVQQDSYDGVFYETDQEDPNYLLLKKGGKGQYYAGLSFDLKWSLDGQSFIGCYKLLGNEFGMEGTLHDGLLELNEDGLQMRFVREGTEIPDAWRLSGQDVSGKQTHLAGEYTLIGMMTGSKTLTQAQVEAAGLADNTVLRIGADGTGAYALNGEAERSFTLDEEHFALDFGSGVTIPYAQEGENLILTQADQNMKLVFERTGGQDDKGDLIDSDLPQTYLPTVAVDSGLFPANILAIRGDWVGMTECYDCSDRYADNINLTCQVVARLVFEPQGGCDVYVKYSLNDPELNLRDLSVEYDPDYGDLVLHGTFMDGQELTPNSFISYVEQDNTLQIGVSIVNSEDGSEMQLYSCLRRHGEDWTGDEHLVLDPEYADAYKDMTFEEVVAYLGQDPNELP